MLHSNLHSKKKIKNTIGPWRADIDKYIRVFQREYNISRNDILNNYSWNDIQEYVMALPTDRIITMGAGPGAKNQERLNEALCYKDDTGAAESMREKRDRFERERERDLGAK